MNGAPKATVVPSAGRDTNSPELSYDASCGETEAGGEGNSILLFNN